MQIDAVSKDVAEAIGLGKPVGALVRAVEPASPADKAGIEAGDIITKVDGKPIDKHSDLPRLIGATKPGTKISVTVFRRGASRDLALMVAEIEPDKVAQKAPEREEKPKQSSVGQALGLTVSELGESAKKELKLKGGVKVDSAVDAAARAGLREGDVITAIANGEVANLKEFEAALAKVDRSKAVNILFRRGEWAQYAVIRPTRP